MDKKGISLSGLIFIIISSSIGAGIFAISSDLAKNSSQGPSLVAWFITGIGVFSLVLTLKNLIFKKPKLNGLSDYAKDGFGSFAGFLSGWGYWLSAWLGNVAFATILISSIGYFFPYFKSENSIQSILLASLISWILMLLVMRGVEDAILINLVVTIAKMVPLFSFIFVSIFLFDGKIFSQEFWGNLSNSVTFKGIGNQVKNSIIVMMWVFVGIEGASTMSSRAKKKSDSGKAAIISIIFLLFIYIMASIAPYGYFTRNEISSMNEPSMVYMFKKMVGPLGAGLMSFGLIISLFGSWLSWTMLPAETLRLMSDQELLPKWVGKVNNKNSPHNALMVTQILVQLFLFSLIFTKEVYNFSYSMATASMVIVYVLVGAYQVKISLKEKDFLNLFYGVIVISFYFIGMILSGIQYLWLLTIAYIPGYFFYVKTRQKNNDKINDNEKTSIIIMILIGFSAIIGIYLGMLKV